MMSTRLKSRSANLEKAATGISGLDEILHGGLPRGRTSLVCGSAGCGKTLFAMEFLIRGAMQFNEPGVFISFEESTTDLGKNVASLGFDLEGLVASKKLSMDFVRLERSEIEETGEYDLEGLFIRLGHAIDSIGAKRVALDTLEALFASLSNEAILRAELRRLFSWLKDRGVSAVITAERGSGTLTRHGLEEYVSDCVILLDHRVQDQVSTRRLRVVKYRGSIHGTNEYPFLIGEHGFTVFPVTSLGLNHAASTERVSSGVERLDFMLGGKGFYRGSSILVSGTAGTGKSTLAAHFAEAACKRGERCLYFAFEESAAQIQRNMRSVGINLENHVKRGFLHFSASRPTSFGLEMHLVTMFDLVQRHKPQVVIIDPITNMLNAGSQKEIESTLTRLVDLLKTRQITAMFTSLTHANSGLESTDAGVSSLMDAWILLRDIEGSGERNRGLYVLKARGIDHSNQIREYRMSPHGISLIDVYIGASGVLTGSARLAQEARERADSITRQNEIAKKKRDLERKRKVMEAQIAALKSEFESLEDEASWVSTTEEKREEVLVKDRQNMSDLRRADTERGKSGSSRTNGKGATE
jgi:circadian clock protein KaiC